MILYNACQMLTTILVRFGAGNCEIEELYMERSVVVMVYRRVPVRGIRRSLFYRSVSRLEYIGLALVPFWCFSGI